LLRLASTPECGDVFTASRMLEQNPQRRRFARLVNHIAAYAQRPEMEERNTGDRCRAETAPVQQETVLVRRSRHDAMLAIEQRFHHARACGAVRSAVRKAR